MTPMTPTWLISHIYIRPIFEGRKTMISNFESLLQIKTCAQAMHSGYSRIGGFSRPKSIFSFLRDIRVSNRSRSWL